jgi:hypothetical protein
MVGLAGALTAVAAARSGRRGWLVLGLVVAATSPTAFAYPLNLLLLTFAAVEVADGILTARRSPIPAR